MASAKPHRWSRWMRFRLRSLLLLLTVSSVIMGTWSLYVQPFRDQAQAAFHVTDCQGIVNSEPAQGPSWQRWLVQQLVGEENFVQVYFVDLRPAKPTEKVFQTLGQLKFLRTLYLDRTDTDDLTLASLYRLKQLEKLSLRYTLVTDNGIKTLVNHPKLETLYLTGTPITDASITSLEKLPQLKDLYIRWAEITTEGLQKLAQTLPDCQIHSHQLTPSSALQP